MFYRIIDVTELRVTAHLLGSGWRDGLTLERLHWATISEVLFNSETAPLKSLIFFFLIPQSCYFRSMDLAENQHPHFLQVYE